MRIDAAGIMKENDNCAITVVDATLGALNLPAPPELLAAAQFFREGMGSGCICGALAGAVMVSGYLHSLRPHPLGDALGRELHERFKHTHGAACCRVIKSKRPVLQRFSRTPCIALTAQFAEEVWQLWSPVFSKKAL